MKIPSHRSGRVLLGAATIFAVVAGGMQSARVVMAVASAQTASGDDSNPNTQSEKQLRRQVEEKKFLREHSDPSGKPRPDLERKGMEHARQMPVAVYIGEHTSTPATHQK